MFAPTLPTLARTLPLVALASFIGCFGSEPTEFPEGLEALEDNAAPVDPTGRERLTMVHGETETHDWVHGRAYVRASTSATWEALKNPDVVVAVCSTDSQSVRIGIDGPYEYGFIVSHEVQSLATVNWDEEWRYGQLGLDGEQEYQGRIRYQKVDGTTAIDLLQGSIEVRETLDTNVTEVQFVEHLEAFSGGTDDMRGSMQHRFDSLRAALAGQPLPACP